MHAAVQWLTGSSSESTSNSWCNVGMEKLLAIPKALLSASGVLGDRTTEAEASNTASANDLSQQTTTSTTDTKLDISYITSQIIVGGLPWRRRTERGSRRNNIDDLSTYLNTYHAGHYMVFNLAPFDNGAQYDYGCFGEQVSLHHISTAQGCPILRQLFTFCAALDAWISVSVKNVAFIHCKSGLLRSALALCTYLLYTKHCDSPHDALEIFTRARIRARDDIDLDSWFSPTYGRYLRYFANILFFSAMFLKYVGKCLVGIVL